MNTTIREYAKNAYDALPSGSPNIDYAQHMVAAAKANGQLEEVALNACREVFPIHHRSWSKFTEPEEELMQVMTSSVTPRTKADRIAKLGPNAKPAKIDNVYQMMRKMFPYKDASGKQAWVKWEDATIEQHEARIRDLGKTIGGLTKTVGFHERAIAEIRNVQGKTLGDVAASVKTELLTAVP